MVSPEEVFRFVAIRDPQRPARAGAIRAPAYDPAAPTNLHQALRNARDTAARGVVADNYISANPPQRRFVASLQEAPEVIRDLDRELIGSLDRRTGRQIRQSALPGLRDLRGPSDSPDPSDSLDSPEDLRSGGTQLGSLLRAEFVHERWGDCADSMLAVTFAARPPVAARVDLARILVLWELLDRLTAEPDMDADEVAGLLATGVILIPSDLLSRAATGRRTPTVSTGADDSDPNGGAEPVDGEPATVRRIRDLVAAAADLRTVARRPASLTIMTVGEAEVHANAAAAAGAYPAGPIPPTLLPETMTMGALLGASLQPGTLTVLEEEGLAVDGRPVPELLDELGVRARAGMDELLATPQLDLQRRAFAAELLRQQPWWARGAFGDGLVTIDLATPTPLSTARLLSRPVIGDLKVVRQTLRGYELGEIAHVENVLIGELKSRRHRVVDTTEQEDTETTTREEDRSFDTQSTNRSELATETQATNASTEQLSAGLTVTASYGEFFSATANAGYSKSQSASEATNSSTRFARELTERAASQLRTRTEVRRRRITRQVVTEANRHDLDNRRNKEHVVGVYRWLNKRYCAQVFNYGKRVLLEIGVPDPSAGFRYAEALGAGLDVNVEPPPPLVFPGTTRPLTPAEIAPEYWQSLAAAFRVADFPPPPPTWITSTLAFSAEAAPQQPTPTDGQDGASPNQPSPPPPGPPPRMYKTNEQLSIPAGYLPSTFTACVLCDRPEGDDQASMLSAGDKTLIRGIAGGFIDSTSPSDQATLRAGLDAWLAWDSYVDVSLTPEQLDGANRIGGLMTLSRQWLDERWRLNLVAFIDAATSRELPRPGLDLAIGPSLVHAPPGAHTIKGPFSWGQLAGRSMEITAAGSSDMTLPVAAATGGGAGFAVTVMVLCQQDWTLEDAWQVEAYQAILAAHAYWEADFRAAVAAAQNQRGVQIQGRNPSENQRIIRTELKRSAIGMLGGVSDVDLRAVEPGNPMPTGTPPQPQPPRVDVHAAARAGWIARFYEQAFEWENIAYILYPYFWTGRADWPAAMLAEDPDPEFAQFLGAGFARVVLPVRPGFENVVESRLSLDLPEPFTTSPAPVPSDDPSLAIADEIRAAQDLAGGKPDGKPWPIVLPTTLVALDGTPMPTYRTVCDPPPDDDGGPTP